MKWLGLLIPLVLLTLATACQEEDKQESTPTPSSTAAATATPQATSSPKATRAPTSTRAAGEIDKSQLQGRIAFYSEADDGICVMNADGTSKTGRITSGWSAEPAWSPEGDEIAFVVGSNDVGHNISVVNADGTEERPLTGGQHYWDNPDWSPDGQRIAFQSSLITPWAGTIQIMNADGTNVVYLLARGVTANEHRPAWSPDGSRIAFKTPSPHAIVVTDIDGREAAHMFEFDGAVDCPAWSPDGKLIAFSMQVEDYRWTIHVMNADGSGVTELAAGSNPTWSPDGRYIAFDRDGGIYVMNHDGTAATYLGEGSDPDWSPK